MHSSSIPSDVLVIGAGPVGLFSVFACGLLGMKCIVLEALDFLGGQCRALYPEKMIYDIPGFSGLSAEDLCSRLEEQIRPFQPEIYLGEKAVSLTKDQQSGRWIVTTESSKSFWTKGIIIAAGEGAFVPKRPPLEHIETLEGTHVFYHVVQKEKFLGHDVVIAGGGDSAVDWAIGLSSIARLVHLVHRRETFRAQPASLEKLKECVHQEKLVLHVPFQLDGLEITEGELRGVQVVDFDGKKRWIPANYLLPFFGLSSDLGGLSSWGLKVEKNKILIQPGTSETNLAGICAVGDIATYPYKLKLIMTGFAECAQAAHHLQRYIWPNRHHRFQHSTTIGLPEQSSMQQH